MQKRVLWLDETKIHFTFYIQNAVKKKPNTAGTFRWGDKTLLEVKVNII